jgi:hypothetical protein
MSDRGKRHAAEVGCGIMAMSAIALVAGGIVLALILLLAR